MNGHSLNEAIDSLGGHSMQAGGSYLSNSAGRLRVIVDEIQVRASDVKGNILQIGKLLREAKPIVGQGHFQAWIGTHFDFSYSCAHNFMNVHRCCMGRPELVESIPATVLYAICAPGFPADLREYLFENKPRLEDIGHIRVRAIGRKYKEKQIDLASPEITALVAYYEQGEREAENEKSVDLFLKELDAFKEMVLKVASRCRAAMKEELETSPEQAAEMRVIVQDMVEAVQLLRPAGYRQMAATLG